MYMYILVKFRFEVQCELNGKVNLWPLETLASGDILRNIWQKSEELGG